MKLQFLAASVTLLAATATPTTPHDLTRASANSEVELHETSTRIFDRDLPNVPGKQLLALEVSYLPGASTPSHRHPETAFVFAYVLSGEIESVVNDEQPRIYHTGESWHETPGSHHRVSRNASKTKPAKLLAVFVADSGTGQLVFPDAK